jgi:signal transduction histidine kinase
MRSEYCPGHEREPFDQLTGGIAHDFNNLLHVIKNATAILRQRMQHEDADVRKYFGMVERNADRAATVTHRLLAFSRQQPLSWRKKPASAALR